MCGRYNIVPNAQAWADVAQVLGQIVADGLNAEPVRYNIAPTEQVPIIVADGDAEPMLLQARWGFIPHWWTKPELPSLTTNARSETAGTLNMWREAWRTQRCLIPASGWYEWFTLEEGNNNPKKIPHRVTRCDGEQILFAGLWSTWRANPDADPLATCSIVTLPSPPDIASIHERTPVVLNPVHWRAWLDPELTDAERVAAMVSDGAVAHFRLQPLAPTVGNSRNKGEDCLQPQLWPDLLSQGSLRCSPAQLLWLRNTPAAELMAALHARLGEGDAANAASRRLWLRELGDRTDASRFEPFFEQLRSSLRPAARSMPCTTTRQGELF